MFLPGRSLAAWVLWTALVLPMGHVAQMIQQQQLPAECQEIESCTSAHRADWARFRQHLQQAIVLEATNPLGAMEVLHGLMEAYTRDANLALDCRMGSASVFFRLGTHYHRLGFSQRAANLYQLAMSMFWDTTKQPYGMACLEFPIWGVNWHQDFMSVYLSHAAKLQRNFMEMLPHPAHWTVPHNYRDPGLRIAIFSLCDYAPTHQMHWLLSRSKKNRETYTSLHGYGMEWTDRKPSSSSSRHPVWGQLAGPLELLEEQPSRYDWVFSMDCDSLFVNTSVTVDSLLYRFAARETPWGKLELDPDVHWLISEDGRGLAGGNWIVRNSQRGRDFLRSVYGVDDEQSNPYLRHDLRDQFSLLWHLVRPGVSLPLPTEGPMSTDSPSIPPPKSWADVGYLPGVRLVPQDLLLGSYPYVSCSQPADSTHRCYRGSPATQEPLDFIISIPLLGALPQNMAQAVLDRFLLESVGTLGDPGYDAQLRQLCNHMDISRCLVDNSAAGGAAPGVR
eukprot:TRINITY_DN59391_c0_g1_i1.p1 TRINITY_DN59391_c0_g1~~TRINITY_DN59391_c0_g1_i1.p1  ORF type:complete len:505 (+),score=48.41 TRINITY_DN59391_c0_g1_i1:94-1608(+)